jgi:putative restriction endonuclease
MKTEIRQNWTRKELILAINLYCKTPFSKIGSRNPQFIKLAKLIGRTPGSISFKLSNFAHIDPTLDRKGFSNCSKLDREIWGEFFNDWETLAFESENVLAHFEKRDLIQEFTKKEDSYIGKEKERIVKTRVNQSFFRKSILASYNNTCCITGIKSPKLLNASHIIPWSKDEHNRLNPSNGLCLNALHDKAFDIGLITLDEELRVVASSELKGKKLIAEEEQFLKYEGTKIILPTKFLPDQTFLSWHRENLFVG